MTPSRWREVTPTRESRGPRRWGRGEGEEEEGVKKDETWGLRGLSEPTSAVVETTQLFRRHWTGVRERSGQGPVTKVWET